MASRGRGSQIKGKNFERRVAKQLTDWYGEKLRRVPNSGGLNIKSDIMTDNVHHMHKFPFRFELKCQERWNVRDYFTQAEEGCEEGKIPAVIFTRNNDHVFVMMRLDHFLDYTKEKDKCQGT